MMKRFLVRCAIAGAMFGGAAVASFSAVSSGASSGIAIGSSSAAPAAAAPALAAPAAQAPNTGTATTTAAVAPAAAVPPAPSNSCVGAAVSAAQQTLKGTGESFGDIFRDSGTGLHPADAIKEFATLNCMKH
jgi:hypothetical protein